MKFFLNAALAVVPPLIARLADSFGLSPTQAGTLIGLYGASRLVVIPPLGLYLTQASRAIGVVLVGILVSFIGTVLFGAGWGYTWLLAGRALVGIGHGMVYLAGLSLILSLCRKSQVARMTNIWEAVGVGSFLVHGIAGGVIGDRWGWQAAFVWAAASVVVSGIVLFFGVGAFKRESLRDVLVEERSDRPSPSFRGLQRGTVYTLIFCTTFTLSVCWTGVLITLIPLYGGSSLGLNSSQIGTVLAAAYLLYIILLFPAGRAMDRRPRTILLVPAWVILMLGVLLLPQTESYWSYLLVSAFFTAGFVIWNVPSTLVADLRLGPQQGFVLGLVRFVGDAGNFLAPVSLGYLVERAGNGAAAGAVALMLIGNLFLAVFDLARRRGASFRTS